MKNFVQEWLKKYIAQEVPPELAICEFECNKIYCHRSDCSNCELWKSYNCFLKAPLN
uniref:Uncharacterized protein n=1 Tax=Gloeothece verrucosa (strain PCC 7822) TaxID=497965 RepID=E0U5C9_GLOV7|nr:hypothetical protein Cyan7822_1525 [Gloeothece verrucosa PCC 7822]